VFWRLLRSQPQRPDLVARFTGTRVSVSMASAMPYELDGEDRPATDQLDFTIEPSALSVRVAGNGEETSDAK
jgi:diacylglycerol kinase family enzyme